MKQFERLELLLPLMGSSSSRDKKNAVKNIIDKSIFNLAHFKDIYVNLNGQWETDNQSRSLRRWLHTHIFLDDFIVTYNETKETSLFNESFHILYNWLKKFPISKKNNVDPLAYHDEGTAQRLLFWLKYYHTFHHCFNQTQLKIFEDKIDETADLLLDDKFYAGLNNHGMFQDFSLVAYSIYKFSDFEKSDIFNGSLNRIVNYYDKVFTEEGVHKEHAPSYHVILLNSLKKLLIVLKEIKFEDNRIQFLKSIMNKGEYYLLNIITPQFKLPNISDSSEITLGGQYKEIFNSLEYSFISSMGKKGVAPKNLMTKFPKSGYLVARSSWEKNATYFLFLAAYHVRYHKHSDDLSFLLYKNIPIFVDAGPYSYNYKDPMTTYAYSQYAHSSLIVNEESLPRTDEKYNNVYLKDYKVDEESVSFSVEGMNERYENVTHSRKIDGNMKTGTFIITDTIFSKIKNKYQILFQINGMLTVILKAHKILIFESKKLIAELNIINCLGVNHFNIELIREQKSPKLMGYQFPQKEVIEPMNTLVISFSNRNDVASVITEIKLLD